MSEKDNYCVMDLEIIKNINYLIERKMLLYGTSQKAEELWEIIEHAQLPIIAVCDSFEEKIGKLFKTFKIQSFEECCKNLDIENICIVICSSYVKEIISYCKNISEKRLNFITPFGLQWAYLLNRNNRILSFKFRQWYNQKWEQYFYIRTNEYINYIRKEYFSNINKIFFKNPILIYQSGKVGSRTVYDSLINIGIDALHIHNFQPYFNCFTLEESEKIKKRLIKNIEERNKIIKIISLVRDPVARDISLIFQSMFDPVRWMYKDFSNDIEKSIINYMENILCGINRISELDDDLYKNNIEVKVGTLGHMLNWFEVELKQVFGINVYEYDFDRSIGYSIIKKSNIECLIIKLEKLDNCLDIIKDFLNIKGNFYLSKTNISEDKEYSYVYQKIKEQIIIPDKLLERYYNKKQLKHFYTDEEIDKFKSKWKK